ncbi:MSMEG_0570 family nitrogen starvation response protein [Actinomycetospora straminea]|uniref:MSMEG_0570 family nitrogen starvation response protein n=1 Tax=Actinomycetospora straminea TaxID=663607 RepID=A0ABP9EPB4_9PSEU|nr:MSMEG_0570 family nitrogen starvation response protein [Actinomycetospora straminea]MDD7936384.1 MSMEG_0570 family nitrogen starvation response protein [Actinomycetospora straminea]
MPEVHVRLRWPDGTARRYYSPSLVLTEHVEEGAGYATPDLLVRARTALTEASERVRARYGFPCGLAAASLAAIEQDAARHGAAPGVVRVEGFDR